MDLKNLPLATTPGGTAFCLKALHPSEHTIKSARVPGGNKMSVPLCSDGVFDIPIANNNSRIEISLNPNPVIICSAAVSHASGGSYVTDARYDFFNSAFSGSSRSCMENHPNPATFKQYVHDFTSAVSEFRITSQSLTGELIAPALSDQGTVTAVQFNAGHADGSGQILDMTPEKDEKAMLDDGDEPLRDTLQQKLMRDWIAFDQPMDPTKAILGTSAYTAKAREGVYMPLKLSKFKWISAKDLTVPFVRSANQMKEDYSIHATNDNLVWPYFVDRSGCSKYQNLEYIPKFAGYNFGYVVFDGLSASTSVRLRLRQVVEITARPSTTYAPLLENALPPDMTALKMYAEISARMADAYPASYNDLGKLKDFIVGLGKKVLPYVEPGLDLLSKMPGPIGLVGSVGKQVVPVARAIGTAVAAKRTEKKKANSAPVPAGTKSKK